MDDRNKNCLQLAYSLPRYVTLNTLIVRSSLQKSFALLNVSQQILPQKQVIYQAFLFGLNLELQGGLKVRGSWINFIIQKLLKIKNPCGFFIPILKVSVTNLRGFFNLRNFYVTKLISEPLTLRPPCSSNLRPNKKSWIYQILLG